MTGIEIEKIEILPTSGAQLSRTACVTLRVRRGGEIRMDFTVPMEFHIQPGEEDRVVGLARKGFLELVGQLQTWTKEWPDRQPA